MVKIDVPLMSCLVASSIALDMSTYQSAAANWPVHDQSNSVTSAGALPAMSAVTSLGRMSSQLRGDRPSQMLDAGQQRAADGRKLWRRRCATDAPRHRGEQRAAREGAAGVAPVAAEFCAGLDGGDVAGELGRSVLDDGEGGWV